MAGADSTAMNAPPLGAHPHQTRFHQHIFGGTHGRITHKVRPRPSTHTGGPINQSEIGGGHRPVSRLSHTVLAQILSHSARDY